jgi:hypothetical protein
MANPRCYSIDTSYAVASPTKTALTLTSTTAIRPEIYEMIWGFSGTPADNSFTAFVQRFTAAGTNTSLTPQALDPADPAATAVAGKNNTVEPTYTAGAILFHSVLNQRATHRWTAYDDKKALKFPATANNGGGAYAVNASATPNLELQIYFNE